MISVTTGQLCHWNMKSVRGNMYMNGHHDVSIKLYLWTLKCAFSCVTIHSSYDLINTTLLCYRGRQRHEVVCHAKSLQSRQTLRDPVDCSLPGSSVHGLLQARILKWVAISFSRGSSQPRHRTRIVYVSCTGRFFFFFFFFFLPLATPGESTGVRGMKP